MHFYLFLGLLPPTSASTGNQKHFDLPKQSNFKLFYSICCAFIVLLHNKVHVCRHTKASTYEVVLSIACYKCMLAVGCWRQMHNQYGRTSLGAAVIEWRGSVTYNWYFWILILVSRAVIRVVFSLFGYLWENDWLIMATATYKRVLLWFFAIRYV